MPSILISTSSFAKESNKPLQWLTKAGFSYELNPHGRKLTTEETIALLKDKVGVIAGTEAYPKGVLEQLPNLKVISRCGAGTDGIDKEYLQFRGIALFNTPEVHVTAVAELAMAGLLSLTRKITLHHNATTSGQWKKTMGTNLAEKTIGLVGFGKVGQSLAKLLLAFGCKVLAFDPYYKGVPHQGVTMVSSFDDVLVADVISLHAPATTDTINLLNRDVLAHVKSNVIILNTSRGELVDEQALLEFLQKHPEAGAYLDVFQQEPYQGPLLSLPNVVVTPHIGTFTRETRVNMEQEAVDNLVNYFKTHG